MQVRENSCWWHICRKRGTQATHDSVAQNALGKLWTWAMGYKGNTVMNPDGIDSRGRNQVRRLILTGTIMCFEDGVSRTRND